MKKKFILILLCLIFFTTGCSNLFISDNTVVVIDREAKLTGKSESMVTTQRGRMCSNSNNTFLSIGISNQSYSIDQYDPANNTLVNVIVSDTRIFEVQAAKEGFYYSRINPADPSNIQLIWSSFDKTTERTITTTADNIENIIFAFGNDRVVFINNSNEFVFSDSLGNRKTYPIDQPIDVSKLIWDDKNNSGFVIATEQEYNDYSLYRISLNNNELNSSYIASHVTDMDYFNNNLVYLVQKDNKTFVYQIPNTEYPTPLPLFSDENIQNISYNNNGTAVYFSIRLNIGIRSTIWLYDLNSTLKYQLTSPIRLISPIFTGQNDNQIIFSVIQQYYQENNNIIQSQNYITNLKYSLD